MRSNDTSPSRRSVRLARFRGNCFVSLTVAAVSMSLTGCSTYTLHKPGTYANAQQLVVSKPDLNAYDPSGNTPLTSVARGQVGVSDEEAARIIELYISEGADVTAPDKYGRYPLSYCFGPNLCTRTLVAHGADPYAVDSNGLSAIGRHYKQLYQGPQKKLEEIALLDIGFTFYEGAINQSAIVEIHDAAGQTIYNLLDDALATNRSARNDFICTRKELGQMIDSLAIVTFQRLNAGLDLVRQKFQVPPGTYKVYVVHTGHGLPIRTSASATDMTALLTAIDPANDQQPMTFTLPEGSCSVGAKGGTIYTITGVTSTNGEMKLSVTSRSGL